MVERVTLKTWRTSVGLVIRRTIYAVANLLIFASIFPMMPSFTRTATPYLRLYLPILTLEVIFLLAGLLVFMSLLAISARSKQYDLTLVVASYLVLWAIVGIVVLLVGAGSIRVRTAPIGVEHLFFYNRPLRIYMLFALPIHWSLLAFVPPIKRFRTRYILESVYDEEE
jgi:hypothetical protein